MRPGLIVGGRWQFAAMLDPNESYLGVTTAAGETARFLDVIGAFVDYYPNEVFFSSRWSVGALAQLSAYHYSTTEARVSSVSDGLLSTLAAAFTVN